MGFHFRDPTDAGAFREMKRNGGDRRVHWGRNGKRDSGLDFGEKTVECDYSDRGQRTEDRGQRTEDRGQRTEDVMFLSMRQQPMI
jgi:hypothetical protein